MATGNKISDYSAIGTPQSTDLILVDQSPSGGGYKSQSRSSLLSDYLKTATATTITAVHTFNPGSAGPPFALGANATGQKVTGLNADQLDGYGAEAMGPVLYASVTNSTAVANTVTETLCDKNYTILVNRLAAGSVVRLVAKGVYSTTGTPTLRVRARCGGVSGATFFDSGAQTCINNAVAAYWMVMAEFTIRSAGPGAVGSQGFSIGGIAAASGSGMVMNQASGALSLDTTVTNVIGVTLTWGAASPSNTAFMSNFEVQIFDAASTS